MIVRPRPNLLQLFFIIRGSIVMRIFPQILTVAGLSAIIVWMHRSRPDLLPNFDGAPFALLGIALSVFLAFRNNACYDRWWEARRHWGELIYNARSLARQTLILDSESRQRLLSLTMAFVQGLVAQLRPGGDITKINRHLSAADIERYNISNNPPDTLLQAMQLEITKLRANGTIGDIPYQMFTVPSARWQQFRRHVNVFTQPPYPSATPCCSTVQLIRSASCCHLALPIY